MLWLEFKNFREPNMTKISRGYKSKSLTVSYLSILHYFQLLLILQSICLLSYSGPKCVSACLCSSLFLIDLFAILFIWVHSVHFLSLRSIPLHDSHRSFSFSHSKSMNFLGANQNTPSNHFLACVLLKSIKRLFGRFMSSKLIFSNNLRILVKFLKF